MAILPGQKSGHYNEVAVRPAPLYIIHKFRGELVSVYFYVLCTIVKEQKHIMTVSSPIITSEF